MQSKYTFPIIILFTLSIIFPLEILPQRNSDERIKKRLPEKNAPVYRERPNQTPKNPGIKNPPPPVNQNPPEQQPYKPPFYEPAPPTCYNPPRRPNPHPPEIVILDYKLSGKEELKDGDYEKALEYLSHAVGLDSNDYELYYFKGIAEIKLQFYEEALKDLNFFLDYIIYEPDGYFQRGLAEFYLTEKEKAKIDFEIAAEMGHKQAISILRRFY